MDSEAVLRADAVALADRISALLTSVRSFEAEIGSLLMEIESRGVMELFGYRSVARLFEHLADVPKSAAEAVVKRARALTASHTLDGTPIPAVAPATGTAALAGRLSTPMIDTIIGVMAQIPPEHRDEAEQHLLTFASEAGHRQVAALGARIVAHLDPDGAEPEETEPGIPSRELSLRRKRTGVWELNGRFDDETGTRANALLDSLAQRRTTDEGPDLRSPQERYGDAFSDTIDLALNSPDLPLQAGERAHVMVTVSLEDLKTSITQATFCSTGTMPDARAGQAARAETLPRTGQTILGDTGTPPRPRTGRAILDGAETRLGPAPAGPPSPTPRTRLRPAPAGPSSATSAPSPPPKPASTPATAHSSPQSSAQRANPSTSATNAASSPPHSAAPSTSATAAAPSPAATAHPDTAKATTSATGQTAAPPPWPTSS